MKKLLTTLPILLISIGAIAQNKPVEQLKAKTDTMYHLKPVDVFNRAIMLQQAAQLVLRPDDFSANQKKFIIRMADSLSNVDGTWYNGVKGVKK